jgi:DNA-binding MarR family transcriptional regulator
MMKISRSLWLLARSKRSHRPGGWWSRRSARLLLSSAQLAMNAIFFASKRAFHGVLRVTRKPLKSLGLTAARFDLLYALMAGRSEDLIVNGRLQSDLRRMLGVSASVISRMLQSLERLGLVGRERPAQGGDRRQRLVRLTAAGIECIAAAHKKLVRAAKRLVYEAICFGKHRDPGAQFVHMAQLESYLRAMRTHYGDTASLAYPWHPDD